MPESNDELKKRWAEIAEKFKYNDCIEAEIWGGRAMRECPVCGEKAIQGDPLTDPDYWIIIHKDPELITN